MKQWYALYVFQYSYQSFYVSFIHMFIYTSRVLYWHHAFVESLKYPLEDMDKGDHYKLIITTKINKKYGRHIISFIQSIM